MINYRARRFIYLLADPLTKSVRYVGCSLNPQKRFEDHVNCCSGIPQLYGWVRELRSIGKQPLLFVLQSVESYGLARDAEESWISYFAKKDASLFNKRGRITTNEYVHAMHLEREKRRQRRKAWLLQKRAMRAIHAGVSPKPQGTPRPQRLITAFGETLSLSKWAKRCGISRQRMHQRLAKFTVEEAIGRYVTA